jgi:hypothetical protein
VTSTTQAGPTATARPLSRAGTSLAVVETLNTGFLPAEVSSVRQFRFEQAQGPSASQLELKRLNEPSDKLFFRVIYLCAGPSSPCREQEQGSPTFLRPCMRLQISSLQSLIISKDVHVLRIRLSIFDNGGTSKEALITSDHKYPFATSTRSPHFKTCKPRGGWMLQTTHRAYFLQAKGSAEISPKCQTGPGHP